MCKLKSGLVLKNRVFVPEYDSHDRMLKELGIEDNYLNARKTFVRVELSPADDDVFSDIDTWELTVDQDFKPDWWNEEEYKPQIVDAVKEWAKGHIHIGQDNLKIRSGENHYIKDCKDVTVYNNATVRACDSATVRAYGNATVEAYGNATVRACDSATVRAYGNATVEAYGNATVRACGSATVRAYGNATVRACGSATVIKTEYSSFLESALVLIDNATFKDCATKTIYQAGDWKLVSVNGKVSDYAEN